MALKDWTPNKPAIIRLPQEKIVTIIKEHIRLKKLNFLLR